MKKLREKVKNIFLYLIVLVFIILVFLFGGYNELSTPPDNAIVFIDELSDTYFAPPLLEVDDRDFLISTALGFVRDQKIKAANSEIEMFTKNWPSEQVAYWDIKKNEYYLVPKSGFRILHVERLGNLEGKDYSPDEIHRKMDGFFDEKDLFDVIYIKLGFRKERWREDGGWNW